MALLLLPIASAVSDTTPPNLISFDFEPKVADVSQSDQVVKFTAQIEDDLSGMSSGFARFSSPSGKQIRSAIFYKSYLVSGDNRNGTYVYYLTVPTYSESGKWYICRFLLLDKIGNGQDLNETERQKLGFIEVKS